MENKATKITCKMCYRYLYLKKNTNKYYPCCFRNPDMNKHSDCMLPDVNKCHCTENLVGVEYLGGAENEVATEGAENLEVVVADLLRQIAELKKENEELRARNNFLEARSSYIWNNVVDVEEHVEDFVEDDDDKMAECERLMLEDLNNDEENYEEYEKFEKFENFGNFGGGGF